jgi:hypothetical protein
MCPAKRKHCRLVQVVNAWVVHDVAQKSEGLAHDTSPYQRDFIERSPSNHSNGMTAIFLGPVRLNSISNTHARAVATIDNAADGKGARAAEGKQAMSEYIAERNAERAPRPRG